jgi:hypothetical protein
MIGVLLTLALLAALAASLRRALRRRRIDTVAASLPGATPEYAVAVGDIGGIDAALRTRRCICGGLLSSLGERSEAHGERMLRVVRAECRRCEKIQIIYFDTATVFH